MRISRNPGFSQPLSDFTAKRNPDRTPRSLSAGGQFRPARACARVLDARAIFTARAPPPRVPERCSWQDYLQSKPAEEAKHKESRVLLEINFHFFGMPASTPLVSSGLQRSSQARFANCWCQVHVALVPQALKFQRPSLGLWLADFGRELLKFQNWRPPILFLGLLCCFCSFFFWGGGGGRVNFRELA